MTARPLLLRRGEFVDVTVDARTVPAMVGLAGPAAGGESLILLFDGILRGYVGVMPVQWDDACGYVDLIQSQPITITRRPPGDAL